MRNVYKRGTRQVVRRNARAWERRFDVRVTAELPHVTVTFTVGETLSFICRWYPLLHGVQWLTEDRMALDKVPGLYVREKSLARNGPRQENE